jgi:hypothetical protein
MNFLIWMFFVLSSSTSLLALSDEDDLPTFSWESNGIEISPNLRITFPDGSEDVAVLKEFNLIDQKSFDEEIDPCIFDGFLKFEKDVYVTLTGCANTNNFQVFIIFHLFKMFILLINNIFYY